MADEIIKDKNVEETADVAPAPKRRGRPPKAKPQPPIEADAKESDATEEKAEVVEEKAEAAESESVESEAVPENVPVEDDSTSDSIDKPSDTENTSEESEATTDVPDTAVAAELDDEAANCKTVDSAPNRQILLTPSIPLYRGPADKFRIKGASGIATVLGTDGEFTKIEYLRRGLGKQIGYVKIYE